MKLSLILWVCGVAVVCGFVSELFREIKEKWRKEVVFWIC